MAISPNGDGIQDEMSLAIAVTASESVRAWRLAILAGQESVMEWKGTGNVPKSISWNGTSLARLPVPDGRYTAAFHAEYPNGDSTEVNLGPLVVDRVAPKAEAKVGGTIFSPNDDGINDSLPIQQTSVASDTWRGTILDSAAKSCAAGHGKALCSPSSGTAETVRAIVAADGKYQYRLESKDAAGNAFGYTSPLFEIETEKKAVRLTLSDRAFSPNSDGVKDVEVFTASVVSPEKVKEYVLQVVGQDGPAALSAVRTWKGETPMERF
jgi:hypothetical protein